MHTMQTKQWLVDEKKVKFWMFQYQMHVGFKNNFCPDLFVNKWKL